MLSACVRFTFSSTLTAGYFEGEFQPSVLSHFPPRGPFLDHALTLGQSVHLNKFGPWSHILGFIPLEGSKHGSGFLFPSLRPGLQAFLFGWAVGKGKVKILVVFKGRSYFGGCYYGGTPVPLKIAFISLYTVL